MPKEGDVCKDCKKGLLEYFTINQNLQELKCNNPDCPQSHHAIRSIGVSNENDKLSSLEPRDQYFQYRSKYLEDVGRTAAQREKLESIKRKKEAGWNKFLFTNLLITNKAPMSKS